MKKILLGVLLLIVGCGGNGGSNPASVQGTKSWVTVGVIDSGFDPSVLEYTYVYDTTGVDPIPNNNHGARVVSVIQEYSDAALIGILPWYTICTMEGCASNYVEFIDNILWAVDNGIQVINISWSGCCLSNPTGYEQAATYAFNRGVTVVWAAGNSGSVLPALNDPHILVIGSIYGTSSTGDAVDAYLDETGGTSFNAAKASGLIAELYEELNPPPDAVGATMIRNEFIKRYGS
jgi:subtilisin family serine protease